MLSYEGCGLGLKCVDWNKATIKNTYRTCLHKRFHLGIVGKYLLTKGPELLVCSLELLLGLEENT